MTTCENKIRETTPFTISTNNIKYPRITQSKGKILTTKCTGLQRKKLKTSEDGKISHTHEST